MSDKGDRLARMASAMLPVAALAATGACLLPDKLLVLIGILLTAWACASVPIGVLVGHCALSED